MLKKIWNYIIDSFRKNRIMKIASTSGCDIDGDIVIYKNIKYYINIYDDVVFRI